MSDEVSGGREDSAACGGRELARDEGAAERDRLRRHFRLIDDAVNPVVTRYADQIQCARGCSDCCHQTFEVSALEGAVLKEGLSALAPEDSAAIKTRASRWQPERRDPCPALGDDGQCLLYEYRPRICRKYGIPLWHPDQPQTVRCCPLNFRNSADIDAQLILEPQAKWAEDWIRLRQQLGITTNVNRPIASWLVD